MAEHVATVVWNRDGATFIDNRYSRGHRWQFDGGVEVAASASPHVVKKPYSVEAAVDPEEAFVASLSSCHLLWFLDFAQRAGWVVDDYVDEAEGLMERDEQGRLAITVVTLRPAVRFAGERQPDEAEHHRLHEAAHAACFIASSVRSEVRCEPVLVRA